MRKSLSHKFFLAPLLSASLLVAAACTTNPATGERQFTGLMSPQQEVNVGAAEHEKIVQQMGLVQDQGLQNYVRQIGQRLVQGTERENVSYSFYVVDSDMVNAFALPGGYVYVTRGLMALANSEAQLASVMAHEIGHITGRHSAERYSRGAVTTIGATVLGAALDNPDAARALNLGSDLYLKSYSRDQEYEADSLGIRYLARGGYDTFAAPEFLQSLQRHSELEARASGNGAPPEFFSTHPNTGNRVGRAAQIAGQYEAGANPTVNRDGYLRRIEGLAYGNNSKEGYTRGQTFYHPAIGFKFTMPQGFNILNKPTEVIGQGPNGAVVVFDFAGVDRPADPATYMAQGWLNGQARAPIEQININGMNAATTSFPGRINGRPMDIRLVAIQWKDGSFARFQMGIPQGAGADLVNAYKQTTYSFARLSENEKQAGGSERIRIVTASSGDSVNSLARQSQFENYAVERFRVLNGLNANEAVQAGQKYKIVR